MIAAHPRVVLFLTLVCCTWQWSERVLAQERRYALLIGANQGQAGEETLRYAVEDARRLKQVLEELGGFYPEDTVLLENPDAPRVQTALQRLAQRVAQDNAHAQTLFLVFYSGHADSQNMHLGGTSLAWNTLRDATSRATADVRVLIVDSCRSGRTTRVKGTRVVKRSRVPSSVAAALTAGPEGVAILASTTEDEDAQESDVLKGSFFTHHFLSALRGVADTNRDGIVTLEEAYRYTSDKTIASTVSTVAGIQHPTYRYDIKGRSQVILSQPGFRKSAAELWVNQVGQYLVHREHGEGPLVLEAQVSSSSRLWLAEGKYFIRLRTHERLYEGEVRVQRGRRSVLDTRGFRVIEYAQLVRKGGSVRSSLGAGVWGGYGSAFLEDYPAAPLLALLGSMDLRALTLDTQLRFSKSSYEQPGITTSLNEYAAALGVRKVFDVGPVSLSGGMRVGLAYMSQDFETERQTEDKARWSPSFSTILRTDYHLASGFFLGFEAEARILRSQITDGVATVDSSWPVQGMLSLGAGKEW